MNFEDVRAIALTYEGVVDYVTHGTPSLKVGTHFLLREREPGIIALRCAGIDERDLLLEADPQTFFVTDHYRGYPYTLARLARLDPAQFRVLFETIWRIKALKRHRIAHDAKVGAKSGPESG